MRHGRAALALVLLALPLACAFQGLDPYPAEGEPDADDGPLTRSWFTLEGVFCDTTSVLGPPPPEVFLLVSNRNARVLGSDPVADSDGDGLSDQEADTSPADADTDGDGLNDRVEIYLGALGLDPLISDMPSPCRLMPQPYDDSDKDGLNDCEEKLLGSDPRKHDTDADRYPDGIEFNGGTSYLYNDRYGDLDNDGISNGDEIARHLDPLFAEPAADRAALGYRYRIEEQGTDARGYPCHHFEVTNIRLFDTLETKPGAGRGWNTIVAIVAESPPDSPGPRHRMATVQVQRVEGLPLPEDVILQDGNFVFLP